MCARVKLFLIAILVALAMTNAVCAIGATIPTIVWEQSDLSFMGKAIQCAGYTKTLKECCAFTVFAPINCAWENLCDPTADELLNPRNKSTLTAILLHHIVKGNYTLCELQNAKCCPLQLKTLDGGTITVRAVDSTVCVDGAQLLGEGISASNGMVFKINKVLIPPGVRCR